MFVLTVFITALLWVTFGSQTTHAAGPVATWKGDTLLYDGHQFYANAEAKKDNKLGLKEGTKFYTYAPEASSGSATVKAFIIYFSPGTDPPNEKNATFAKYDYSAQKGYSNQSDKKTIEVTPSGDENSTNSCSVDGIGWVICPVTTWLANGMDALFQFISDNFLKVQPVTVTNTDTNLYVSWNIMRTIANIAFIIVFLMIIYAQLTSTAVSNYGIKKLLPRLIIASILVNVSYFIASLAVDISNILGFSLQEVFVNIRQNTFNITNDTWSAGTQGWTALTTAVLAGVGIGAVAFNPAILFMVVPLLIGAALSALFALLILSVRQAIIIILIIIGPLAFVAYLLPNTEQWFKKWRELFTNMLIFFPAFSLVFGGSQLASSIIMQNATSMFMIALALAVQVAPLAITPLILRFSGGVLGRIAGLVNNPRKGFLDRSKNWANKRVDAGRQTALGNNSTKNPFRKAMQRVAYSDHRMDNKIETGKAKTGAWMSDRDNTTAVGQKLQTETALAKLASEESHHEMDQAIQEARAGSDAGLRRMRMQEDITIVDRVRARMNDQTVDEMRTSRYAIERDENGNIINATPFGKYAEEVTKRAVHLDQNGRAVETATAIAKNKQLTEYAKNVENNAHDLRIKASGIGGETGQQGALAAAFKAQAGAHNDAVSNAASIMNRYNYTDDIVGKIALAEIGTQPTGAHFPVSATIKEAAILKIAGGRNGGEIQKLLENIQIDDTEATQDFRQAFADAIIANPARPKYAGAGYVADIKRGHTIREDGSTAPIPAPGPGRIEQYIIGTVNSDKFGSADVLVSQDRDYIERLASVVTNPEARGKMGPAHQATLLQAIDTIKADPIYSGKVGERKKAIDSIERILLNDAEVVRIRNIKNEKTQERDKEVHGE
jgi:hypothetical protein